MWAFRAERRGDWGRLFLGWGRRSHKLSGPRRQGRAGLCTELASAPWARRGCPRSDAPAGDCGKEQAREGNYSEGPWDGPEMVSWTDRFTPRLLCPVSTFPVLFGIACPRLTRWPPVPCGQGRQTLEHRNEWRRLLRGPSLLPTHFYSTLSSPLGRVCSSLSEKWEFRFPKFLSGLN